MTRVRRTESSSVPGRRPVRAVEGEGSAVGAGQAVALRHGHGLVVLLAAVRRLAVTYRPGRERGEEVMPGQAPRHPVPVAAAAMGEHEDGEGAARACLPVGGGRPRLVSFAL